MLDIRFNSELDYKIDNLGFVKVMRNKDFSFPWRNGKDRHSLIFVERGKMEYNFLNEQNIISANKGELLFIPKNYPYVGTYLEDNTVIRIILFDADKLPQTLSHPIIRKHPPELGSGDTKNTLFLAARVYELLYFLTKDTAYVPKKYSKIIPAIKEFEKNYFLNEKLSFYSDMCGMSESNFRKLFKEYTGKSPVEYRNLIRIIEATKMIESREFTVSEAAYLTGFNNMSFFYDVYNKYNEKKR